MIDRRVLIEHLDWVLRPPLSEDLVASARELAA
jgi:hypothetical protein